MMGTWAKDWWVRLPPIFKLIGTMCGTAAAIAGMVVAVPPAWSMLGLPEVATHVFVLETVRPLQLAQGQTTAAVDRLVLIQLKQSLYDAQKDPAAGTSPIVQDRIMEIKSAIESTQRRIEAGGQGR